MIFVDYLREQAEKYRKLAEAAEDPSAKKGVPGIGGSMREGR